MITLRDCQRESPQDLGRKIDGKICFRKGKLISGLIEVYPLY